MNRKLPLALGAIYLLWGSTYLAIRYALDGFPPFMLGAVRYVLSGALLLGVASALGHERPSPRQFGNAAVTGLLVVLAANGAIIWSEQFIPSGLAALLVASLPLSLLGLEGVFDHRAPGPLALAGALLGIGGVALLVVFAGAHHPGLPLRASALWAEIVVILGTMANAVGIMLGRRLSLPRSGLFQSAGAQLAAATGFLALAVATGEVQRVRWLAVPLLAWAGLAYLVIFGACIGYSAYFWLIRNALPTLVGTYSLVNPVVALTLGVLVLGEPLDARTLVGAAAIVVSVGLVILESASRERTAGIRSR